MVVTNPLVVAVFEHMVTPVRPIIEPLPCLNPWPVFNLHYNACFHRTTNLPKFLYQEPPTKRLSAW